MPAPNATPSLAGMTGTIKESPRKAAKAAGLTWLISFALIAVVEFGIHQRLIIGDPNLGPINAVETARNILANEGMFHLSIAIGLLYGAAVTVVLAAFYVILRCFGRTIALVAAASRVLFAGLWILSSAELFHVVRLLAGPGDLRAFSQDQLHALVSLSLGLRWDYYYAGLLFWGLSTTLFSWLWLKSGYLPKSFAVFGIASAAWATLCAFAFIASPAFANTVNPWWFDTPLAVFELTLSVLLLVKPLRSKSVAAAD